MITPFKKPQGGELLDWQKEFNKQVNKIRYIIEQVIANFKTWRIMHTDYRRWQHSQKQSQLWSPCTSTQPPE
jgi:hypothetical protein